MRYTIVNGDDNCLEVRATVSTRAELESLITILSRRLETDFAQEENHDHASNGPVRSSLPAPTGSAGS